MLFSGLGKFLLLYFDGEKKRILNSSIRGLLTFFYSMLQPIRNSNNQETLGYNRRIHLTAKQQDVDLPFFIYFLKQSRMVEL